MSQSVSQRLVTRGPEFSNRAVYVCSVVEKEEMGHVSYMYFFFPSSYLYTTSP